MIKNIAFIFLLTVTTVSNAQFYKTYNWEETPQKHQLTEKEAKESSVAILKKHIVEYTKGLFNQGLRVFETKHTIVHVNDDKGINRHNTVYIPMYDVKNLIDVKARTITAEGKITNFNKENIKEINNVEEYGDFKIFAIEGAEKGSEIELLYTVEKEYDLQGSETLQADFAVREAQFIFITGDFNADAKAYRTHETFNIDYIDDKKARVLTIKDIPAMIEEEYATPKANNIAVVYQCFPKEQNITQEMFWNNVVNNVGRKFFPEKVNDIIKGDIKNIITDDKEYSDYQKATLLDDYIKNNFTIVKNNNEELTDLTTILENKSASDFGIIKIYAHYLKALNIPYEVVLTANRFEHKFDPEFFNPSGLRNFVIYLPNEEKYISPDRIEYRVGEAPFNLLGNYGLFITETFEYYFSEIIQTDANFSTINRKTNITFNDDIESVTLEQYQEYTGHWASTYRTVLNLYPEEMQVEFQDQLTSSGIEDKVIDNFKSDNIDMAQMDYNKPLIINSQITSESLLEEAGDSYIFQIGKVIGLQSELYQETERVNPIEMMYPNQYDYVLTINIPEGYVAEGLDALNIDKSYKSVKGNKLCKFESSYKLEGNKVIITIQEFYKSNVYDIARYEEFRTVINAASDFNKAAILIKAIE